MKKWIARTGAFVFMLALVLLAVNGMYVLSHFSFYTVVFPQTTIEFAESTFAIISVAWLAICSFIFATMVFSALVEIMKWCFRESDL